MTLHDLLKRSPNRGAYTADVDYENVWEYVGFSERMQTDVPTYTYRLEVPGGWIYRVDYHAPVYVPPSLIFVPDNARTERER